MSFFSRLTDIVTCNLTEILECEADPVAAIEKIIFEMKEGRAGALRSVKTAKANAERLRKELDEHQSLVEYWTEQAKAELARDNEDEARAALARKREVEDLIAGIEQQHQAAVTTQVHLTTTLHALEARLADAGRRQREMTDGGAVKTPVAANANGGATAASANETRAREIESELEALKREMGQGT